MFSNKFAVLQVHNVNPKQSPKQPKPKGDKEVNSVPGPKNDQKEEVKSNENRPVRDNNNNNRRGGEYRGRGGNRGGRGGNRGGRGGSSLSSAEQKDPSLRNKRRYDRNSNVPKNESKKGNFGPGNWGTEKEDARGSDDAKKELEKVGEDAGSEVKAEGAENVVVVEQAPEDKTITMKQYEEQRAALAPKIEAPKRREAGEGEKSNDLEKFTELKKGDDEDFAKLNIKIKEKKKKSAQPKKQTISLDVFQEDGNRNNNNNNNRGGKKPYQNNRSKPKKLSISIEDHTNFPALGK